MQVRSAVTEMLDAWVGVTNAGCVMPEVMDVSDVVKRVFKLQALSPFLITSVDIPSAHDSFM